VLYQSRATGAENHPGGPGLKASRSEEVMK
jgi:hypothetical protein